LVCGLIGCHLGLSSGDSVGFSLGFFLQFLSFLSVFLGLEKLLVVIFIAASVVTAWSTGTSGKEGVNIDNVLQETPLSLNLSFTSRV